MNYYAETKSWGKAKYYKTAIISGKYKSLDRVLITGWHDVNPSYGIKREKGLSVALLIMTVGGVGNIEVNGKKYQVKAGDVAILPPQLHHEYACQKQGNWEFYWIDFAGEHAFSLVNDITRNEQYVFNLGAKTLDLSIKPLLEEGVIKEIEDSETLDRLLSEILYKNEELQIMNTSSLCASVLVDIESWGNSDFSISTIASKYNYSKEYVIRQFEKQFGIPPYKYWLMLKLRRASVDVVAGSLSVNEIALKYGYESVSSFSKQFKKYFSLSPKEYKSSVLHDN